jgi:N-acetylglutamate synthase-like GNAT family acetyltransferase
MYTHKGVSYRPAVLADVPGLAYFLVNITEENELIGVLKHDFVSGSKVLKDLIQQNQGVTIIAEKDDKIIGCMILGKTTLWWAKTFIFTNLAFYVAPEFRKGFGVQDKLLEFTKDFSESVKTPILFSLFDVTDKKLKVLKYLNRKGFQTVGVQGAYIPKGT